MGLLVTGKPHLSRARLLEWRMHRDEQFMANPKERIERLESPAPSAPMATVTGAVLSALLNAPASVGAPGPIANHNQGDD